MIDRSGDYGAVTALSGQLGVSRQTLYEWKATGRRALEAAFAPAASAPAVRPGLERAVLTLLVEGHASVRGIRDCLAEMGFGAVGLGTIGEVVGAAGGRALDWLAQLRGPAAARGLALDEIYGNQRRGGYLSVVDTASGLVWAAAGPVAVDHESWTLVLWDLAERGVRWSRTVADGGGAIGRACRAVDPEGEHARDVWHVLHRCGQAQGRLDRRLSELRAQAPAVARQAARVAAGGRPRGSRPRADEAAHAAHLAAASAAAAALGYLGRQLRLLLGVVVLAHGRPLSAAERAAELAALAQLLAELAASAPAELRPELERLRRHLAEALPALTLFAPALDRSQRAATAALGAEAVALVAWAWQRRAILGPTSADLLAQLPASWRGAAARLLAAWDGAVRASSAAENWHSVLRPHLAVHRTPSPGLLALLAFRHNHRVATRGAHAGTSPLQRSGLPQASADWLTALGYPPASHALSPRQPTPLPVSTPMAA